MIIRTGPNRFRSPTALNGAGGEALFNSFAGFGADDFETVNLNYGKWMEESENLLNQYHARLVELYDFVSNPPFFADKNSMQAIRGLYNRQNSVIFPELRDSREQACTDAVLYKKWLTKLSLYANEAAALLAEKDSQGLWNALAYTAKQTADDIVTTINVVGGKIVDVGAWPTWLKVVGGVAAVAGAAYVVNSFTTAAKVVRGR
jgi:hypothetical protein